MMFNKMQKAVERDMAAIAAKKRRRVIQIASREAHGSSRPGLWALCSDGSLWLHTPNPLADGQWEHVPEIPQGPPQ